MLTACREYRPRLMELARGMAEPDERRMLMAHVDLCADCARALDEQLALSAALRGLAADPLPEMAGIEVRVLAEFDRAASRRRMAAWVWAAGLAAVLLLGVIAVERRAPVSFVHQRVVRPQVQVSTANAVEAGPEMRPMPPRSRAPVTRVRHNIAGRPPSEEGAPFMPIPYTVPLAPGERATIVQMEVPVAALIAAGYHVETADPGAVLDAEVLVSQDGRARAIRLNSKEEER